MVSAFLNFTHIFIKDGSDAGIVITTDFADFKTRYEKDSSQIGYNMFKI